MFYKKIIYSVVVTLFILVVAVASYHFYLGKNKKASSCSVNSDCTLIYSGNSKCAPCDQSLESYKCALPDEVEKIREERKLIAGNIACVPCPPASKTYGCLCKNEACQKVKK